MPVFAFSQVSVRNLTLVKKLIADKKYEEAVSATTQLLVDGDDVQLYSLRASANHQLKNFNSEIEDYKKILIFNDEDPKTRFALAGAYFSAKDTLEAIKTAQKNTQVHPKYIPSYAFLAFVASKRKENELALKILTDAYDKLQSPTLLSIRAAAYRKQGKYEDALGDYETLMAGRTVPKTVYFSAAQTASEVGDFKKTLRYYETYLEKDPNNSAALNNVGRELQSIGKFTDAAVYYRKSLEVTPGNIFPLSGQALLAYKKGNVDEAFSILDASLLSSRNSKSKINYFIRGYLNAYEGNLADAEADFKATLSDSQQKKYVLNALATIYVYKGEYAKAIEFASENIDSSVEPLPEPYNIRGFAEYKMGKKEDAVKDYLAAIALEDDYQPTFRYVQNGANQPVENYTHVQFLTPFNNVNDCKSAFYTDGNKTLDFKIRIISNADVDVSKIKLFEKDKPLDTKYWSVEGSTKRTFKLMDMLVTDVALTFIPNANRSYLTVFYNDASTQKVTIRK